MQNKKIKITNEIPIFPLPNVVFFPKTLLPLHIFEERYRKMVVDALAGSNQIGMALLKQGWEKDYFGNPDVYEIGCVGDIQFSEKLNKGKFNIMLYGLSRVKILKFVQNKPYRIAQVKILKDTNFDYDGFNENFETASFLRSVRKYLSEMGVEKVNKFLNLNLRSYSFESIVNQVATVLDFTIHEKQTLLEMDSIELRYDKLKSLLQYKLITLKIAKNVKFVPENPGWN